MKTKNIYSNDQNLKSYDSPASFRQCLLVKNAFSAIVMMMITSAVLSTWLSKNLFSQELPVVQI